jgi:NAD-dependent dihydropyrimidine dehydrogenase PreA subunit
MALATAQLIVLPARSAFEYFLWSLAPGLKEKQSDEKMQRASSVFLDLDQVPGSQTMADFHRRQVTMHKRILVRLRIIVQAVFALICLWAGYRFYQFYNWAIGQTETFVPKPPAVEGFLPISALLGFKRFVMTGKWDEIHPAGLTIFVCALALAFLLRKSFCGWICPVGFVSNITAKIGRRIHLDFELPRWLDYPLLGAKYLLLGFFGYIILWRMDVRMIEAFLYSQYNLVVDAKMLLFFLHPSMLTLKVLAVLFLVSLIVRNFWCRFLCPYGALLGLGALVGALWIKREGSQCIHCGECERICPASIRITQNRTIRHAECIGCAECVEVCPRKDCLTLQTFAKKRIPLYAFPIAVVGLFVLFWAIALLSGHWHAGISPDAFKQLYPAAAAVSHP